MRPLPSCPFVFSAILATLLLGCKGHGGSGAPDDWDGKSPLLCGGHQTLSLKGKTVQMSTGPAIILGGDCVATLESCIIHAPIGVSVGGNAHATLKNVQIESGTTMQPVSMASAGTDPTMLAVAAEQMVVKPGTPYFAAGNGELTIEGGHASGKLALYASGNAKVTVNGGTLTGTEHAIDANGGAVVHAQVAKVEGAVQHRGSSKVTGVPGGT